MTKKEAIWRIVDHMEVHKIGQYPHVRLAEALEMAIDALRAQQPIAKLDRTRWEGCSHCNGKCCCTCIHGVLGINDEPCCSCCRIESKYKAGNYCPVCGRPLTEEAWAELERRIGGNDGATD